MKASAMSLNEVISESGLSQNSSGIHRAPLLVREYLAQKETQRFSMPEVPKSDEAKSEKSKLLSWLQTVPGFLSAVAALITALTGLAVAGYQIRDAQISAPSGSEQASPEKPDAAASQIRKIWVGYPADAMSECEIGARHFRIFAAVRSGTFRYDLVDARLA